MHAVGPGHDQPFHPVDPALGTDHAVARQNRHIGHGTRTLHTVAHFDDRGHRNAAGQRDPCGIERQIARAQDHHTASGKGLVAGDQRAECQRAHHPRLVPPGKGQRAIARAGGQNEVFKPCGPRFFAIGHGQHRARQGAGVFAVAPQAPGHRAQPHIDPGLEAFGDQRLVCHQCFEQAFGRLQRGSGAPAKPQRHVGSGQRGRHGVFIDQRHLPPGIGGGQRRGKPGRAGPDDQDIERFIGGGNLAIDRETVVNSLAHMCSSAWVKSAIRSSGCSIPIDRRIVPSVIPPAARSAAGTL